MKKDANPELQVKSPVEFLRSLFLERKQRNASYSTRAFARDLDISQTLLSLVMNGKRNLTVKQAVKMGVLLNLSKADSARFIESTLLSLPENSKAVSKLRHAHRNAAVAVKPLHKSFEMERFKVIGQWYHTALLDLVTTKDFKDDTVWISRRLGISPIEARDAIARLVDLGMLERKDRKLVKPQQRVYFATQKSEPAVRNFHTQMMTKAIDQMKLTDETDFEARLITGTTMAIRKSALPEAKKLIHQFQQELAVLLGAEECDEVYQLNIQMFPLSQKIKIKNLKK